MIKQYFLTGDTHGNFSRFKHYENNPDNAIIILGDAGFNFYLNHRDDDLKKFITNKYKFTIYCVRGNHETRSQNVSGMLYAYDENVDKYVEFLETGLTNYKNNK